jgi:hypothetical protein
MGARAVATSNTEGLHNRLDAMYVDKLDGRIENAFFDRMAASWRSEIPTFGLFGPKRMDSTFSFSPPLCIQIWGLEHHTFSCSNLADVRQRLGVLAEPTIS